MASEAETPVLIARELAGPAVGGDDAPANVLSRLRKDAEFVRDRVGAPGCQERRDAMVMIDLIDTFGPAWIERQRRVAIVRSLRDLAKEIEAHRSVDDVRHHAARMGMELDEVENELGLLRADGSSAAD